MKHKFSGCLIAIGLAVSFTNFASADTFVFIGADSSSYLNDNWSTNNNWLNNTAPTSDINNTIIALSATFRPNSVMNIADFKAKEIRFFTNQTLVLNENLTTKAIVNYQGSNGRIHLNNNSLVVNRDNAISTVQSYQGSIVGNGNLTFTGSGVIADNNTIQITSGSFEDVNYLNSGANMFLGIQNNRYSIRNSRLQNNSGVTTITGTVVDTVITNVGGQTSLNFVAMNGGGVNVNGGSVVLYESISNAYINMNNGSFFAGDAEITNVTFTISGGVFNNAQDDSFINTSNIRVFLGGEFQNRGRIDSTPIRLEAGKFWNTNRITNSTITVSGGTFRHGANTDGSILNANAVLNTNQIDISGGNFYSYANINPQSGKVTINQNVNNGFLFGYSETGTFPNHTIRVNKNATLNNAILNINTGKSFSMGQFTNSTINIAANTELTVGRTHEPNTALFSSDAGITNCKINIAALGDLEVYGKIINSTVNFEGDVSISDRTVNNVEYRGTATGTRFISNNSGRFFNYGTVSHSFISITDTTGHTDVDEIELLDDSIFENSTIYLKDGQILIEKAIVRDSVLTIVGTNSKYKDESDSTVQDTTINFESCQEANLKGTYTRVNLFLTNINGTTEGSDIRLSAGTFNNGNISLLKNSEIYQENTINNSNIYLFNDAKFYADGTINNSTVVVQGGLFENRYIINGTTLNVANGTIDFKKVDANYSTFTNGTINMTGGSLNNAHKILDTNITISGVATALNSSTGIIGGANYSAGIVYSKLILNGGTFTNQGSIENKTITISSGLFTNNAAIKIPRGDQDIDNLNYNDPTPNGWLEVAGSKMVNNGTITAKDPTAPNKGDAILLISNNGILENNATITQIEGIGIIESGKIVMKGTSSITDLDDGIFMYDNSQFEHHNGVISANITIDGGQFWHSGGVISASNIYTKKGIFKISKDTTLNSFSFGKNGTFITSIYETGSGQTRDVHAYTLTSTTSGTLENGTTLHIREGEDFIDINNDEEITLMRANTGLPTDLSNIKLTDYSAVLNFTLKRGGTDNKDIIAVAQRTAYQTVGTTTIAKEVGAQIDAIRQEGGDNLRDFLYEIERIPNLEGINETLLHLAPRQQLSARLLTHNAGLAALAQMSAYRNTRRQALKGMPYKLTINPAESGLANTDTNPGTTLAQALPLTPGERQEREVGKDKMVNVYARATTGYTRVGSGGARIGLRSSRVGAVFGIDVRLHENMLIGFTGSYDYNDVHFASHLGSGRVNSYRFGPYAMLFHNDWFFETELTIGLHNNSFRRNVVVSGTTYRPESRYDSIDFTASIGGGYDFHIGGFTITPRANLQYQFFHANSHSEKNGGDAALKIDKYNTSALSSRIGAEFWKRFEIGQSYLSSLTPFINVGWRYEWLAPSDLRSQFLGGGSSFNINNDLFSRSAIYIGAGSSFEITDQLNIDLRYQADIGDRENVSQNAYISLRYKF